MNFTAESARAAMALGPVQFVCNVCGQKHTSEDWLWGCARERCWRYWLYAHQRCNLKRTREAACRLKDAVHAVNARYPGYGLAGVRIAQRIQSTEISLLRCIDALDSDRYGEGRREAIEALMSALSYNQRCCWILMVPEARIDGDVACIIRKRLCALRRRVDGVIHDCLNVAPVCDKKLRRNLARACDALVVELDAMEQAVAQLCAQANGETEGA